MLMKPAPTVGNAPRAGDGAARGNSPANARQERKKGACARAMRRESARGDCGATFRGTRGTRARRAARAGRGIRRRATAPARRVDLAFWIFLVKSRYFAYSGRIRGNRARVAPPRIARRRYFILEPRERLTTNALAMSRRGVDGGGT